MTWKVSLFLLIAAIAVSIVLTLLLPGRGFVLLLPFLFVPGLFRARFRR